MFSVVEMSDGVLAIPTKWINKKKKICLYPKDEHNEVELIKKNRDADADWPKMSILRIFSTASTYKEAKEKVDIALTTSDLEDENLRKSRKQRRKRVDSSDEENCAAKEKKNSLNRFRHENTDESSDEENCAQKGKKQNLNCIRQGTDESSDEDLVITNNPFNQNLNNCKKNADANNCENSKKGSKNINNLSYSDQLQYAISLGEENVKKNNRILTELNEIKKILKEEQTNSSNSELKNKKGKHYEATTSEFSLPLKSIDEYEELETKLNKDKEYKDVLVIKNTIIQQ